MKNSVMRTKPLPKKTAEEIEWSFFLDRIVKRLREISSKAKSSLMYWSETLSEPRCYRHRTKKSYGEDNSEEDGQRFCEKCGKILECAFTNCGVEDVIGYAVELGNVDQPVSATEAFSLLNVISCGVPRLTERCGDFVYRADFKDALKIIAKRLGIQS